MHGLNTAFVRAGHQHHELIPADARSAVGRIHGFGQHFADAPQHGVARRVAMLVIDGLEAIHVQGNHGDRPRPFACQAVELFRVKSAVAQLGQHIVLAQVLQVRLGFFAGGNVHQR